jgi:regulator of sigma E protease
VLEAESTTIIGYVETNGPAYLAGLRTGDRIVEVDGKPVTKFGGMGSSISWRVVRSEGSTIPIKFERTQEDGSIKAMQVEVTPVKDTTKAWERKSLRKIKVEPYHSHRVGQVVPGSPAERAGIQPGDQVVEVNGVKSLLYGTLADYMDQNPGAALKLKVLRNGRPVELVAKPEVPINSEKPEDAKPRLGVAWEQMTLAHPSVSEQIVGSVDALLSTVGALISRKSDIKPQHLSGAVKIINIYYILFQSDYGWRQALWFSVILNINLALLNLLPIPVLDGGHIVLSIIEGIRRRPVNARIVGYIQTACAMLLIGYMLYVTFFDLQDSTWRLNNDKPAQELKFAPATAPAPAPAK